MVSAPEHTFWLAPNSPPMLCRTSRPSMENGSPGSAEERFAVYVSLARTAPADGGWRRVSRSCRAWRIRIRSAGVSAGAADARSGGWGTQRWE